MPTDLAIWISLALGLIADITLNDLPHDDRIIRGMLTTTRNVSACTLCFLLIVNATAFFSR